MGAYGCALYAIGQANGHARPISELLAMAETESRPLNCKGCENHCRITCYTFASGKRYYSGNKCERVFTNGQKSEYKGVNLSLERYNELFNRAEYNEPPKEQALLTLGIPRVLNMYEEFPFWYRLFTDCGIRVQVSSTSSYANYEKGVHSVMSDNICFPAKLVHSHIYELDDREDIDRIFFPRVMYEPAEDKTATSSLNCPVIIGYPEVIHSSVKTHKTVDSPVISFRNSRGLLRQVTAYLLSLGVPKEKIRPAFRNALADQQTFAQTMRQRNLEVLERAQAENRLCILLAGRPYHTDPLIQHNVSEMIADMGVDVLTEDIVRHTDFKERESFILKQWTFVNRILNAAQWVAGQGRLVHIVETTSFGCGPDAFFVDEVRAILNRHNKPFTLLKIDDINNIGSMRLRVRSLVNSLQLNKAGQEQQPKPFVQLARFEKGDKHKRVILAPYFTEYLSPLMPSAFEYAGYKVVQLPMGNAENNELGLRYANNEVCYPATLIVGGFIKALQSGEYDPDKTAIAITQLGKCRATNYPALIRRAIVEAGFSQVPVIGIGGTDNMDNPGFRLNYLKVAPMVMAGTFFTDWLAVFYHAIAVRENVKGTARALRDEFLERAKLLAATGNAKGLVRLVGQAAEAFNAVPVHEERIYPKVGITGEIFLKFNPYSHRYVPDWLMAHGVEVVPSAVHYFFLRSFVNYDYNKRMHVTDPLVPSFVVEMLWKWIHGIMLDCEKQASVFRYFRPFPDIRTLSAYAGEVLELSAQFGEGWLLPAEVIGFLHEGCNNVVSMQPFGCIANHIVARGIEKKLKTAHPELNMLSLDFDGGVSESNIANRLLLFLNGIKYK